MQSWFPILVTSRRRVALAEACATWLTIQLGDTDLSLDRMLLDLFGNRRSPQHTAQSHGLDNR